MDVSRLVDYSAPNLKGDGAAALLKEIVRFVSGIKGRRQNPVTKAQIIKYFKATPPDFVDAQICALVASGEIAIRRRSLSSGRQANGGYVYEAA